MKPESPAEKPVKVVIDTNILVSGLLNPHGAPGLIIELLLNKKIMCVIDDRILSEYRSVLNYTKFPFSEQQVNTLLDFIVNFDIHTTSKLSPILLPDISDQPFAEVARAANVAALITGNTKHFPGIKTVV